MPYNPQQLPAPAPVAPQAPPPAGDIAQPVTGAPAVRWQIPQTAAQQAILDAQRDAISAQIENVRSRRNAIARSYERSSGANRAGLEQQLRVLDNRILQLEQDLAESGRARYESTAVPTTGVSPHFPIPNLNSGEMTAISIVFIVFVLGPITGSIARTVWRRSAKPAMPQGWSEATQRLERLEQSVDTIAVEVERVSEGQRFMTKLMTQAPVSANGSVAAAASAMNGAQPLPALGPGAPDPLVVQRERDEVRVRRS
jgi:hypothetical protein